MAIEDGTDGNLLLPGLDVEEEVVAGEDRVVSRPLLPRTRIGRGEGVLAVFVVRLFQLLGGLVVGVLDARSLGRVVIANRLS